MLVEQLDQLGKIGERTGQPIDLIDQTMSILPDRTLARRFCRAGRSSELADPVSRTPHEMYQRGQPASAWRLNWSELFPAVVTAVSLLEVRSCLIDSAVVVCDEQGLAVFDLLRRGDRVKQNAHLYAFDLLELDGRNLIRVSIEERKHELARLLTQGPRAGVQLCEHIDQPGDVVFAHACKLGCEGIVSKRLGSKYRPGPNRCSDWLKVKNPAATAVKREAEEDWGKRR
jgi:hypothetical protein